MDTHALNPLKIMAFDHDDLHILAAHIQDAVIPLHSLLYDPENATFSALCNRFCWEHHDQHFFEEDPLFHRVHSGLCFRHVKSVKHKGFQRHKDSHPLNLLTLHAEDKGGYANVHLLFSGHSEILLEVDKIHCNLGDLHHPWPTKKKPHHDH